MIYFIFGFVALYLILCLFGSSVTTVERAVEIDAAPEFLKAKMTDLYFFHDKWSPWTEKDPRMKVSYKGNPGEEGSSMSWISDKKAVMEIDQDLKTASMNKFQIPAGKVLHIAYYGPYDASIHVHYAMAA